MNDDYSILKLSNVVNISVACVVEKNGKYLMIKEKDGWNFPSGKVNFKEDPIAACVRETVEETGVETKVAAIISVYYYKTRNNSYDKKEDRVTFRLNFKAEYLLENGAEKLESNIEPFWLTKEEINNLVVQKKFRNWIAESLAIEVLSNKQYPLDLLTTR